MASRYAVYPIVISDISLFPHLIAASVGAVVNHIMLGVGWKSLTFYAKF